MRKEEKTQITRERILAAALDEFGTKGYDAASVNTICEKGHISKGLLYHNFKGKDDLYLYCVQNSYEKMTAALQQQPFPISNAEESLHTFLHLRQQFLTENPKYATIFFNAVLMPPKHLRENLRNLRKDFDAYLHKCYSEILGCLTLRAGVTKEDALEYFLLISETFNGYFQQKAEETGNFEKIVEDHEEQLSKLFHFMLYGVAKEPQ